MGAISGATTSAAVVFLASGLLSPIPGQLRGIGAMCALVLLGLHHTRVLCLDLPQRAHQIPRETFTMSPPLAAFRFAFELGTGVRTFVTATSPYALAIVLLLCLPSTLGRAALAVVASAAGYGLGRSLIVTVQSLRSSIAVDHPVRWLRSGDLVALCFAVVIAVRFLQQIN